MRNHANQAEMFNYANKSNKTFKPRVSEDSLVNLFDDTLAEKSDQNEAKPKAWNERDKLLKEIEQNGTSKLKCLPKAIFNCEKDSHPFARREVYIKDAVKIGRVVVGSKVTTESCLFDSRVLSRNHAILSYRDNKFLLKDTKSSNGTFVNGVRLGNPSEESAEFELFSGDLIKFGVDIVEDAGPSGSGNVCPPVITTVALFHADGRQALRSVWYGNELSNIKHVSVPSNQLILLSYHLRLAHKNQSNLQSKLQLLEAQLSSAENSIKKGWKSVVTEDMLLTRIETLQNKLQTAMIPRMSGTQKNSAGAYSDKEKRTMDTLLEDIVELQREKEAYESNSKKKMQALYEQRSKDEGRITKLAGQLMSAENECERLKKLIEEMQKAIDSSNERICEQEQKLEEKKKKQAETSDKMLQISLDKMCLEQKLVDCQARETQLNEKLQELNVELEAKQLQLNVYMQSMSKNGIMLDSLIKDSQEESKLQSQLASFSLASSSNASPPTTNDCTNHLNELELIKKSVESVQQSKCDLENKLKEMQKEKSDLEQKCAQLESDNQVLKQECTNMQISSAKREQELNCALEEKQRVVTDLSDHRDTLNDKLIKLQQELSLKIGQIQISEQEKIQAQSALTAMAATVAQFEAQLNQARQEVQSLQTQLKQTDEQMKSKDELMQHQAARLAQFESHQQDMQTETLVRDVLDSMLDRIERENDLDSLINATACHSSSPPTFNIQQSNCLNTDNNFDLEQQVENLRLENVNLHEELKKLNDEYQMLSYNNKVAYLFALFPLCILLASMVIAYLPFVSLITGTKEP